VDHVRRLVAALPLVALPWALGACGSGQQPRADDQSPASQTSTAPVDSGSPNPEPVAGKPVRVSGTISPGVEHGCHVITTGATTYLLIWEGGPLVDGERVKVSQRWSRTG
jgi:hypothetical protein